MTLSLEENERQDVGVTKGRRMRVKDWGFENREMKGQEPMGTVFIDK